MQINHKREHDPFLNLTGDIGGPPQALLLSVCRADTCIPVYIKGQKALSLLWLSDLTEIGSPMLIRVNNDVTGGLTNDQWSIPL